MYEEILKKKTCIQIWNFSRDPVFKYDILEKTTMEYHLIFVAVMECVEYLEGIFGQEKSNLVDSRL